MAKKGKNQVSISSLTITPIMRQVLCKVFLRSNPSVAMEHYKNYIHADHF